MQNLNKTCKYSHIHQFKSRFLYISHKNYGNCEVLCDIFNWGEKVERNLVKGRNLKYLYNLNKNANTELN